MSLFFVLLSIHLLIIFDLSIRHFIDFRKKSIDNSLQFITVRAVFMIGSLV